MTTAAPHAPLGAHPTPVARGVRWLRHHRWPSLGIGLLVILFIVIIGVVSRSGGSTKKAATTPAKVSTNPIVASYQGQLPALAAAVQKAPADANAIRAYGVALYATGDVSQALTQYQAELKLSPKDAVLLNNLGNVYRDLGTYDKAVQSYQSSISIDPKTATAYINLSNLYNYTLKQPQLAITTIQEAQRNIPNNPDLGVLLGITYEQTKDTKDATAAYNAVLAESPNNAAATAGLKRLAG